MQYNCLVQLVHFNVHVKMLSSWVNPQCFLNIFYCFALIINIYSLDCTIIQVCCSISHTAGLCNIIKKMKFSFTNHEYYYRIHLRKMYSKCTASSVFCHFSSMKCMFKTPSSVGSSVSRKRRLTPLTGIDLNETDISWTESLATPSTSHAANWGKSYLLALRSACSPRSIWR